MGMPLSQTQIISCANSSACDTYLSKERHSVASDGSECNTYLSKECHSVASDGSECNTYLSKECHSVVSPQESFPCVHYFHNFTASLSQGLITMG